jgi:hypothetical protein
LGYKEFAWQRAVDLELRGGTNLFQTDREIGGSMRIDRTTKILLLLIVLALWANLFASFLRPIAAKADTDSTLSEIESDLSDIKREVRNMGHCKGELKVNPWGLQSTIGGLNVDVQCK